MLNILMSWSYLYHENQVARVREYGPILRLLIDCGAFTNYKLHKPEKSVPEYCAYLDWLQQSGLDVWNYFALDVIRDTSATMRNLEEMVSLGRKPIPIWQRGAPRSHFEEMCSYHDVVAIGGLLGDLSYVRYVSEEVVPPGQKVHWLGIGAPQFLNHYGPYSADSTNPLQVSRFQVFDCYMGNGRWVKGALTRDGVIRKVSRARFSRAVERVGVDARLLLSEGGKLTYDRRSIRQQASCRMHYWYASDLYQRKGTLLFTAHGNTRHIQDDIKAWKWVCENGLYVDY